MKTSQEIENIVKAYLSASKVVCSGFDYWDCYESDIDGQIKALTVVLELIQNDKFCDIEKFSSDLKKLSNSEIPDNKSAFWLENRFAQYLKNLLIKINAPIDYNM